MSCECDLRIFPESLTIPAGTTSLARQIAIFPEWRQAILAAIGREPALDDWNSREPNDLGLMLADFWAYVCDVISFYDLATSQESYLRTSRQRTSRRKLVGLLGYVPRPPIASTAVLAALAEGRQTIKLTAGTAFRSIGFNGNPPQVFELGADALVHPLNNRWPIARVLPVQVDPSVSTATVGQLTFDPGTVSLVPGDLVAILGGGLTKVRTVSSVRLTSTLSRQRFVVVTFTSPFTVPGTTPFTSLDVRKSTARAGVWTLPTAALDEAAIGANTLVLDGLHRGIATGQTVILRTLAATVAMTVVNVQEQLRVLLIGPTSAILDINNVKTGSLVSPDIKVPVTRLTLSDSIPAGATAATTSVLYGLARAGRIAPMSKDTLAPQDPIRISGVIETPPVPPGQLMLVDVNGAGVASAGQVNFGNGTVTLAGATWAPPLNAPIQLFGNALTITRGESVHGELIGIGDASQPTQTFVLAKKPLTYLPGGTVDGSPASTLDVHVDGVRWKERPNFYKASELDRIFIVRTDDEGHVLVMFGGGARLPTGSRVVADYRFGAGAASPPAGTITQIARPLKGLKGVSNPLAAFGGAEREGSEELLAYAPRSALLLGRAISLPDFEAAAANVPGVRAVAADWRFSAVAQRPLVHIYYVGNAQLRTTILASLQGLSDPTVPLIVERAIPDARRIDLSITVKGDYVPSMVLNGVREGLFGAATTPGTGGLLRPERLGVAATLFESRISEVVVNTEGVASLDAVLLNHAPFASYGVSPAAGHYLDFESGAVVINGKASYV